MFDYFPRPAETAWSLIVTSFDGNIHRLTDRLYHILGWRRFQRYGLWNISGQQPRLPAEIRSGITRQAAEHIAGLLAPLGAVCEIWPSDRLPPVAQRASDLWAHRLGFWHAYSEAEGFVGKGSPGALRTAIVSARATGKLAHRWSFERGYNHEHPCNSRRTAREQLRQSCEYATHLASELRAAWPERELLVANWLGQDIVSFYQPDDGAPDVDVPPEGDRPQRAFCQRCEGSRAYRIRCEPDAEFPMVEWGDCEECNSELVVRGPQLITHVSPRIGSNASRGAVFARYFPLE